MLWGCAKGRGSTLAAAHTLPALRTAAHLALLNGARRLVQAAGQAVVLQRLLQQPQEQPLCDPQCPCASEVDTLDAAGRMRRATQGTQCTLDQPTHPSDILVLGV